MNKENTFEKNVINGGTMMKEDKIENDFIKEKIDTANNQDEVSTGDNIVNGPRPPSFEGPEILVYMKNRDDVPGTIVRMEKKDWQKNFKAKALLDWSTVDHNKNILLKEKEAIENLRINKKLFRKKVYLKNLEERKNALKAIDKKIKACDLAMNEILSCRAVELRPYKVGKNTKYKDVFLITVKDAIGGIIDEWKRECKQNKPVE